MKFIILILVSSACLTANAYEKCRHVEYAELKEMKPLTLALEFCANNSALKRMVIDKETNEKLISIKSQYHGGNSKEVIDIRTEQDAIYEFSKECTSENERIRLLLEKKKIKPADKELLSSCDYR